MDMVRNRGSKGMDRCPLTGESVVEGLAMMQATTQDEEVGESERDDVVVTGLLGSAR
jgi:hypothetical protein